MNLQLSNMCAKQVRGVVCEVILAVDWVIDPQDALKVGVLAHQCGA
jgi:hypothetical protein